jgi:hypothetical protein
VRVLFLTAFVVAACAGGAAHAQDFVGARALSLGEAYRAIATGNDAIYMNPAGMALVPRYSPELHYQLNLNEEDHQVDASIVDSKTSPVAAGVAYTFQGAQFTKRATLQHTATLALAYPLFDKVFVVGTGLKYVNVWDAFVGNYLNALSADLGFISQIPGGLSFAGVGYNLIPIQSARVPLSGAVAVAWDLGPLSALIFGGSPSFGPAMNATGTTVDDPLGALRGPLSGLTLSFDWHMAFLTLNGIESRLSGGVEYLLFDMFPLRGGYQWVENTDDHFVSVGAGFIVPFFGLDVGYQQSVNNLSTRTLAVSLKFFIPM